MPLHPSTMPIPLLTAAAQLATTPTALIEMALQGRLVLYVWQPGWIFTGVLFGTDFDIETFTPVELVPELEPPYQLRPGPIQLERHQLDQLRRGRVRICDAGDVVSGFRVLLAEPIELGWDSVLINMEELNALKADSLVRQREADCEKKPRVWPEVLTLTDLASFLRVSRGAAERFAQRNNLVVDVDGRRRVLRSRVEALSSGPVAARTQAKEPTGGSRSSQAVFVLASDC